MAHLQLPFLQTVREMKKGPNFKSPACVLVGSSSAAFALNERMGKTVINGKKKKKSQDRTENPPSDVGSDFHCVCDSQRGFFRLPFRTTRSNLSVGRSVTSENPRRT